LSFSEKVPSYHVKGAERKDAMFTTHPISLGLAYAAKRMGPTSVSSSCKE